MLKRKFGRKKDHRSHMLRNLAASVILFEKVETTEAKAKEVKIVVERALTIAKKNTLAARRSLLALFFDTNVVDKIFDVLVERYADRPSGYTRLLRIGNRFGDNADKFMITLINDKPAAEEPKKAAKAAKSAKSETKAEEATVSATDEKESDNA